MTYNIGLVVSHDYVNHDKILRVIHDIISRHGTCRVYLTSYSYAHNHIAEFLTEEGIRYNTCNGRAITRGAMDISLFFLGSNEFSNNVRDSLGRIDIPHELFHMDDRLENHSFFRLLNDEWGALI